MKQWDLEDNTILIFMTDNGAVGGIRMENGDSDGFPLEPWNRFGANLRGRKGSPYEGGHRVPFFIRWPQGKLAGGKDVAGLTSHTVELNSGPQSIQTWFTEAGGKSRGAFYVEVRRMENPG